MSAELKEALVVEIVYGSFANLSVPSARVVRIETDEVVARCHHRHQSPDAAFECGLRMKRRWLAKEGY